MRLAHGQVYRDLLTSVRFSTGHWHGHGFDFHACVHAGCLCSRVGRASSRPLLGGWYWLPLFLPDTGNVFCCRRWVDAPVPPSHQRQACKREQFTEPRSAPGSERTSSRSWYVNPLGACDRPPLALGSTMPSEGAAGRSWTPVDTAGLRRRLRELPITR